MKNTLRKIVNRGMKMSVGELVIVMIATTFLLTPLTAVAVGAAWYFKPFREFWDYNRLGTPYNHTRIGR